MIKRLYYSVKKHFLTIFGDIRVYRWPMFVVYSPMGFKIKGGDTRDIIDVLQPGDVVMRSYDNYLDGYFIPKGKSGCSHSGVYVGDNVVIHSIAEGSVVDDIIEFCRADRVVVLRPSAGIEWALQHAKKCADKNIPYDFSFQKNNGRYYCHEFTASCYPGLDIRMLSRKGLGFIPSPMVYLADSFYENHNFKVVFER